MGCFGAGFGVERSCFVFLGRWVVLAAFACVDRLTLGVRCWDICIYLI